MAKKKHKHAEHENLERWLISYADFITLLFAVFVALWALKRDNPPTQSVIDGIKRAFNAFGEKTAAQDVKVAITNTGAAEAIFTVEPMYQSIIDAVKKAGVKGVSVHKVDRGVIIRIPDEALFEVGKAEIRENFKGTLDKTAEILREMPNQIQIEGHTDNIPIKTALYPSNWELSTARATALLRHFMERGKIPPTKFAVSGYAEYQPITSNDTPEGRAKNRRVDILVVKQKDDKKPVQTLSAQPGIAPEPSAEAHLKLPSS